MADSKKLAKSPDKKANRRGAARLAAVQALYQMDIAGAGIESLLSTEMQLAGNDTRQQARLSGEARRLLLPGEMGEIFKVIALGRGYESPLSGFSTQTLAL